MTTDDIPESRIATRLPTRLNGREVQNESTANMIHPIASLIAYMLPPLPLSLGDTILTGSPRVEWAKTRVPPLFYMMVMLLKLRLNILEPCAMLAR